MYKIKINSKNRANVMFGSYDLKVRFPDGNIGYVGRGSFNLLSKIKYISGIRQSTPLFKIGNYCEAAQCSIIVGGNHPNNELHNLTFGGNLVLRAILQIETTIVKSTTEIGGAVLLSQDCLILHGSKIGDSAVIGANETVRPTLQVPSFYYFAGGKNIKQRISPIEVEYLRNHPWWLASNEWLIENFHKIRTRALCVIPHEKTSHRLLLNFTPGTDSSGSECDLIGIEMDGVEIHLEHLSTPLKAYFSQIKTQDEFIVWVPDIFKLHAT